MSDYENRNRNSGGGGLLAGLIGLAIAGAATAYKAHKDGIKQSDENEKIRREQADQQEMKRHNAIASADFTPDLEDQSYRNLIDLCETAMCNFAYRENVSGLQCLSEQIDEEKLEQLNQYASKEDAVSGFYAFLLADEESTDEDEYTMLELLAEESYKQNYPYARIIASMHNEEDKTTDNEIAQSDLLIAYNELQKSYEAAKSEENAKPQDLFMFGMLCYFGSGCEEDHELAESAFRLAAQKNFSLAIDALHQYMNIDIANVPIDEQKNDTANEEDTDNDWDDIFDELEDEADDDFTETKLSSEEENDSDDLDSDEFYDVDEVSVENESIESESTPDPTTENIASEETKSNEAPSVPATENKTTQSTSKPIDHCPIQSVDVPCSTLQELVMYMRKYDFHDISYTDIFFPGDTKFEKKLTNAKRAYANASANETAFCLCDTTLFGSAKEGFVLTNQTLYSKPMLESAVAIPLSNIVGIKTKEEKLLVLYGTGENAQEIQLDALMEKGKAEKGAEHLAMLISIARSI